MLSSKCLMDAMFSKLSIYFATGKSLKMPLVFKRSKLLIFFDAYRVVNHHVGRLSVVNTIIVIPEFQFTMISYNQGLKIYLYLTTHWS